MRYNTTVHDLVEIGPFDAIYPPSEHFLKEALNRIELFIKTTSIQVDKHVIQASLL